MRAWLLLVSAALGCAAQPFDLVILGGRVVDGTGNPWYRADVGVRAGKIAAIGDLRGVEARQAVRAEGQVVAPGFIDMMGADSTVLLEHPAAADSKLRQGITTMMAGEGSSAAPQSAGARWTTWSGYLALLERAGLRVNVVHNVGAAQIRRVVIGDTDRAPTGEELDRMKALVAEGMEAGVVGLSTALIYPPGTYAKTDELVELAKVAARYGGFYSTHMRNESRGVLEAIAESIEIGERGGLPVHIYHLKAAGEENWPLMPKAIAAIEAARRRGIDVTADIYPYLRNGIGLGSFIHPRHFAAGTGPLRARLAAAEERAALRREIETTGDWENWYRHVGRNWDNVLVAVARDKSAEGKSLAEVARNRGRDAWEVFFDLVETDEVQVNPKSMNEEQKRVALLAEFVSFCTDAPPTDLASATSAHPRAFGSFPRILKQYVRQERVITLENAIRKMTSLAANRLTLHDRGRIAPGMAADLVVFDPAAIDDRATFERPLQFPTGISYVVVNGEMAVEEGRSTGAKAGRALLRQR